MVRRWNGEGLFPIQNRNSVLSILCKNSEQILSLEKYCKGGNGAILQLLSGSNMLFIFSVSDLAA